MLLGRNLIRQAMSKVTLQREKKKSTHVLTRPFVFSARNFAPRVAHLLNHGIRVLIYAGK